jgi:hypothetical protein
MIAMKNRSEKVLSLQLILRSRELQEILGEKAKNFLIEYTP